MADEEINPVSSAKNTIMSVPSQKMVSIMAPILVIFSMQMVARSTMII